MTRPDEEHSGQPQPGLPDEAPLSEPLEELVWAYEAPLVLTQRDPHPHEHWLLRQAGRSVLAIQPAAGGWSLGTLAERWSAALRRRRRRLGWHLEITRTGEREPTVYYYPYTLLTGGRLTLAGGASYKLRHRPVLKEGWTLAAVGGTELAHIRLSTSLRRISGKALARRAGLTTSAPSEPELMPLMAAACLAIVIHHQQPRGTGSVGA